MTNLLPLSFLGLGAISFICAGFVFFLGGWVPSPPQEPQPETRKSPTHFQSHLDISQRTRPNYPLLQSSPTYFSHMTLGYAAISNCYTVVTFMVVLKMCWQHPHTNTLTAFKKINLSRNIALRLNQLHLRKLPPWRTRPFQMLQEERFITMYIHSPLSMTQSPVALGMIQSSVFHCLLLA